MSFVYNIGGNVFKASQLFNDINGCKDSVTITNDFMKFAYVTINDKIIKSNGLMKRRSLECMVYQGYTLCDEKSLKYAYSRL